MPYGYRRKYTSRRRTRYRGSRSYKPRYRRRQYRRTYRRRRGTTSSVVKLTLDATWQLNNGATPPMWEPFTFSPLSMPGFSDYQTTYSHFRIIKAKLFVSRTIGSNDGSLYNYLVVGSRPFATTNSGNAATNASLMPGQPEEALRQTKWQKMHYPNTTTQRISAGFYPYTLISTMGPAAIGTNSYWYRIWEAKKWMPFKWALATGTNPQQNQGISFYGPFMIVDTNTGELSGTPTVQCTLQLHVQFKGQR